MRTHRFRQRGLSLPELLLVLALFSVVSLLLFSLLNDGFRRWRTANARFDVQNRLMKSMNWLRQDLEKASATQIGHKRVSNGAGHGDALWFLSAEDPSVADPQLRFVRDSSTGAPRWQRQILYYLARPTNYAACSGGILAAVDPDPRNDYFAPHKFLLRKVINTSADPETRSTAGGIDAFVTFPVDYNLSTLASETSVEACRLIADRMLSFEVSLLDRTIELDLRAVYLQPAEKELAVGSVSLKDTKFTVHQKLRVVLKQ